MHETRPLTFENLLRDPMVREVMRSDGVSVAEMVAVLATARAGLVARERQAVRRALVQAGTLPRADSPATRGVATRRPGP